MANLLPSPICLVNSQSTINGVDLAGGATVTIQLANVAGVNSWSCSCIGTDEQQNKIAINASIVLNQAFKTATFTMPTNLTGVALIFESIVNQGIYNNVKNAALSTTFGIYVLTDVGTDRLLAVNETTESNNEFGWITTVNAVIRDQSGGGGGSPTGPAGGDLSGTYPNPQIATGVIVNADVNASAAIAGSKITPNFGSQNVSTTGSGSFNGMTNSGAYAGGTNPAASGIIRLPNASNIRFRNAANSADVDAIAVDSSNNVILGNSSDTAITINDSSDTISLRTAGVIQLAIDANSVDAQDNYITTTSTIRSGTNPAGSGQIRIPNNTGINARNNAGSSDLPLLSSNSSDTLILGNGSTHSYSITSGGTHSINVSNSARITITGSVISLGNPTLRFDETQSAPLITQNSDNTASITAQTLVVGAQNATGTSSTGGDLRLRSGTGTTANGVLRLFTGNNNQISIFDSGIDINTAQLGYSSAVTTPTFGQNTIATNSATGQPLLIRAQNATGTTSNGGILDLRSGTGTTANGIVTIRTGANIQLSINDTTIDAQDNNIVTTGQLFLGSTPATTGLIRIPNNTAINARNAANSANIRLIGISSSNNVLVGDSANSNISLNPTLIEINPAAGFGLTLSSTTITNYIKTLAWDENVTAPVINQVTNGNSTATCQPLTISAQSGSGTTNVTGGLLDLYAGSATGGSGTRNGGQLKLSSGTGATADGYVTINKGATKVFEATNADIIIGDSFTMFEVAVLPSNREVISLCLGAPITNTQMPTNTGDKVIYIANCTTAPTASSVGGGILYVSAGALYFKGSGGTVTPIAGA